MKDLNELVARNFWGRIDIARSIDALQVELEASKDSEYEVECRIESAISDVFYRHNGVTLPMEAFAAEVAQNLNVQPAEYASTIKQIKAYVKLRPSTYTIAKGKGGGIFKNADRPTE